MTAAPVVRWAIKYVRGKGDPYVETGNIAWTRRDAWKKFMNDWGAETLPWADPMMVRARSMRRKREVVAVRVEIREVTE